MAVEKFSISLSPETLAQMDYLRDEMNIYKGVKRSQLISMIIFDAYCRYLPKEKPPLSSSCHGFPDCQDDCNTCSDAFICDYYKGE